MTPELANYLRRHRDPRFALRGLSRLFSRACLSVAYRIAPASRFECPPEIAPLRKRVLGTRQEGQPTDSAEMPLATSVPLATGWFSISGANDWFTVFDDVEQTVALHRWNWLLRGLTAEAERLERERGIALMRSWIATCGALGAPSDEPYTVGERIANGCLFLMLTESGDVPPDLAAAFRAMGVKLADRIEYYRSGDTGNHAFNNARALMFAGLVAGLDEATDLALAISRERLPELVTPEGFLREGSSHYQFLFTRWVLEMLWLAERENHSDFVDLLTPYARRLVKCCWFFLVHSEESGWTFPLFGDVSPDFPPDWLIGLVWSNPACSVYTPEELPPAPAGRGWQNLFRVVSGSAVRHNLGVSDHSADGWIRIDHATWTMILHAERRSGFRSGHSHSDLGSFVLYRDGQPVLIDCGRVDYTLSPLSKYGKSADAHNAIMIDGLGVSADGPSWLSAAYVRVRAIATVERDGNALVVTLDHDGFSRISSGAITHRRTFTLVPGAVTVRDEIRGKGQHRLAARCHFAARIEVVPMASLRWSLKGADAILETDGLPDSAILIGCGTPPIGGLNFPAYGVQQVINTLELSGIVTLPVALTQAIRRESC